MAHHLGLGPVETQVSNWIRVPLGVLRSDTLIGWTLAWFGEGSFPWQVSLCVLVRAPRHAVGSHCDWRVYDHGRALIVFHPNLMGKSLNTANSI
jgi:hypothetical protein